MSTRRAGAAAALVLLASFRSAPAAAEPYVEVRAPGYRVISAVGERAARDYLVELDRFRRLLEASLGVKRAPSGIVTRIVIASSKDWSNTLQPREGIAGYWSPGRFESFLVFDGSAPRRDALQIIFHEYTHDFVQSQLGRDHPAWWGEGFAELMSSVRFNGNRAAFSIPRGHLETLRNLPWLPMESLLTANRDSPEYVNHQHAPSFYAQSWLLVYYGRVENAAFGERLEQLVLAYDRGASTRQSAEAVLGMKFSELDALMREYAGRVRARAPEIELAGASPLEIGPAREIGPAEASSLLAEVVSETGEPQRVARYLDALFGEANDARTLALRALAGARANEADAEARFERATAAAPEPDAETARLLGLVLLARAEARMQPYEPFSNEAVQIAKRSQRLFDLALEREPDSLEAAWGFGLASYYAGDDLERASRQVTSARARAGTSAELAYVAALLAERQAQLEPAREAWRDVVRFARFPQLRDFARERLLALAAEG